MLFTQYDQHDYVEGTEGPSVLLIDHRAKHIQVAINVALGDLINDLAICEIATDELSADEIADEWSFYCAETWEDVFYKDFHAEVIEGYAYESPDLYKGLLKAYRKNYSVRIVLVNGIPRMGF